MIMQDLSLGKTSQMGFNGKTKFTFFHSIAHAMNCTTEIQVKVFSLHDNIYNAILSPGNYGTIPKVPDVTLKGQEVNFLYKG